MPYGYIYIVTTAGRDYEQASFRCAPTYFDGTLYLAACKVPIRRKLQAGGYLFGISPSYTFPRRIVFAARVARRMTFADAYTEFPRLRAPKGPIHVRPTTLPLERFPDSKYEHIPGGGHEDRWRKDIQTLDLDAFFVCEPAGACTGRWLGRAGPAVNGDILRFLRSCSVHGNVGKLAERNDRATETRPVSYRKLFTGLHLETDRPEQLLALVCRNVPKGGPSATRAAVKASSRSCEPRKLRRNRCA